MNRYEPELKPRVFSCMQFVFGLFKSTTDWKFKYIYSVLQSYHTIKVENDKYIVKQDTIHYIKGTNYQLQEKLNLLLAIEKITRTDAACYHSHT